MRLYVVRHGKAERDAPTGRDEDRPLRPRGIRQATWLGETIAEGKHRPEIILASPLVRALDTARILHKLLRAPLEVSDRLATSALVSDHLALVESRRSVKSMAIVGHNPTLSMLVAALTQQGSGEALDLRTGEAAIVEIKGAALLGTGRLLGTLRDPEDD